LPPTWAPFLPFPSFRPKHAQDFFFSTAEQHRREGSQFSAFFFFFSSVPAPRRPPPPSRRVGKTTFGFSSRLPETGTEGLFSSFLRLGMVIVGLLFSLLPPFFPLFFSFFFSRSRQGHKPMRSLLVDAAGRPLFPPSFSRPFWEAGFFLSFQFHTNKSSLRRVFFPPHGKKVVAACPFFFSPPKHFLVHFVFFSSPVPREGDRRPAPLLG